MTMYSVNDARADRRSELAAHARRAWTLLGGRSSEGRNDRDDDDDDMPRPNAIATLFPLFRASSPLPA